MVIVYVKEIKLLKRCLGMFILMWFPHMKRVIRNAKTYSILFLLVDKTNNAIDIGYNIEKE